MVRAGATVDGLEQLHGAPVEHMQQGRGAGQRWHIEVFAVSRGTKAVALIPRWHRHLRLGHAKRKRGSSGKRADRWQRGAP